MINFTAIVVTYNEEKHLDECLKALFFCEEKIVIDLGSHDASVKIAEQNNFTVIRHDWVDIVEKIREWAISMAKNDWIIFMDPDEIFPSKQIETVNSLIEKKQADGFTFARINYFLGEPIKHGRWYGLTGFPRIFNKNSVLLSSSVHDGLKRKPECKYKKLNGLIVHYWIDSLEQFYEKHERYLKREGESRHKRGQRFSFFGMYKSLIIGYIDWYILNHGFLDCKNGKTLIELALWYEKRAWLSLRDYQNSLKLKN